LALLKDWKLTEPFKLQFRAEFYDVTNNAHFAPPNTTVGSPFIGQISSASSLGVPRDIQFALKLSF
jgi:hypothetical protein